MGLHRNFKIICDKQKFSSFVLLPVVHQDSVLFVCLLGGCV